MAPRLFVFEADYKLSRLANSLAACCDTEVMKRVLLLLPLLLNLVAIPATIAQGYRHPPNPYREIERLESEIADLLLQQEKMLADTENRNDRLRQLHNQRDRTNSGNEKTKIDLEINALNNQGRVASTESAKIGIAIQRKEFEIDRITRYIEFSSHTGPSGGGGKPSGGRTPEAKSISVVRSTTEGPVRVTGKGVGHYDITIYEITFSDGSKQRVEDKKFRPNR